MKKYLLSPTAQHKANLHCHTTLSDGRISPEEMVAAYKRHGYRVMAFTDHEYIVNHQDFNDENFIAITGYEIGLYTPELPGSWEDTWRDRKCCHLNLYAKNPYEDRHILFDPDALPNHVKDRTSEFKYIGEKRKRKYEDVQEVIDTANANGFIVCLNHPYWSIQPQSDTVNYRGLFGWEVYNSGGSALAGYNPVVDSILVNDYGAAVESGMTVAPIAADDNHNYNGDIENSDSFKGMTMICTDDFSYSGIIEALERGDFYASTGIEIREVSLEDGRVHIECSPCSNVTVFFGGIRWAHETGNGITSCDFDIPKGARFVRVLCVEGAFESFAATKGFEL